MEECCPGEAWPPARPNPLPRQDPHGAASHIQRLNGLSWEEAVEFQAGLELSVSLRRQVPGLDQGLDLKCFAFLAYD